SLSSASSRSISITSGSSPTCVRNRCGASASVRRRRSPWTPWTGKSSTVGSRASPAERVRCSRCFHRTTRRATSSASCSVCPFAFASPTSRTIRTTFAPACRHASRSIPIATCGKAFRNGEANHAVCKGSRAMRQRKGNTNLGDRWPALILVALVFLSGGPANLQAQPAASAPPESGERLPPPRLTTPSEPQLPPPRTMAPSKSDNAQLPPQTLSPPQPLRLADAIRRSLANVETVKANVAVQTATIGRFEALKQFVPLINLPQLMVGFRQFSGSGDVLIFPDVTDGVLLKGRPALQAAALNRFNLFFPLDPSGHITALPVAEEGIRAKVLMEQLVRRSQVMLGIQHYFETKQVLYGIRTAQLGLTFAQENLALTERKLKAEQAHDVEVTEARVAEKKANVLLTELEKDLRISQRHLAVVLHQSRLLVPQTEQPIPITLDHEYGFFLEDPDVVDLQVVPDFPTSREEAIQLAKRQRIEVRLLLVGLRIARLQRDRSLLGL